MHSTCPFPSDIRWDLLFQIIVYLPLWDVSTENGQVCELLINGGSEQAVATWVANIDSLLIERGWNDNKKKETRG